MWSVEFASLEIRWWNMNDGGATDRIHVLYGTATLVSDADKPSSPWRRVSMVASPHSVLATWERRDFRALTEQRMRPAFNQYATHDKTQQPGLFIPPYTGPGVGLCVENARAVFRNVRLIPLNAP
jgi:hypothetical protein